MNLTTACLLKPFQCHHLWVWQDWLVSAMLRLFNAYLGILVALTCGTSNLLLIDELISH